MTKLLELFLVVHTVYWAIAGFALWWFIAHFLAKGYSRTRSLDDSARSAAGLALVLDAVALAGASLIVSGFHVVEGAVRVFAGVTLPMIVAVVTSIASRRD